MTGSSVPWRSIRWGMSCTNFRKRWMLFMRRNVKWNSPPIILPLRFIRKIRRDDTMTDSETAAPQVSAQALRAMLGDGRELALLDVREEGVFATGHLLTAAC